MSSRKVSFCPVLVITKISLVIRVWIRTWTLKNLNVNNNSKQTLFYPGYLGHP